ncbi:phage virion morphogenesis protein [Pseudomonas sp. CBMAI 2609]|uniref:Phage virion morphogenesis protein n=1 Tax=Pseudomonas flavocrustae TaxID=2991719 RepID=A0ABT6IEV1_9PSED|nr:phage virion morphogenesis protein [Pseudomonas sp. CBMAI 2609]MDH4763042.1 phage virion morphogenesis protein [Pseudomonas sp. CBMAI 2609]
MADLEALETWLSPLLQKLDGRGRAQLARKAAQELRRSQQQRIRAQVNPGGSPYAPRKPRDLRGKKGRIKGRMFEKLKMARYLKTKGSPQAAVVGFTGRVARIARVHHYGLKDRAERVAPEVRYSSRELLGVTDREKEIFWEAVANAMGL